MKSYLVIIATSLGMLAFGLSVTSCSNGSSGGGTHRMGPPSKSYPMSDRIMPNRAN